MMIRTACVLGAVLALASAARAGDIIVSGASIQSAVDLAEPGDRIIVRKGLYPEAVVVDKAEITLESRGAVIDGQYEAPCITVTADDVTIDGFHLLHGGDADGVRHTIFYTGDRAVVKNNVIERGAGMGVFVVGNDATVSGNEISDGAGGGCRANINDDTSVTTFANNRVERCAWGFRAKGGQLEVTGNHLMALSFFGLDLDPEILTSTTGIAARVVDNVLTQIGDIAVDLDSTEGGLSRIEGNRIGMVGSVAVDYDGSAGSTIELVNNRIHTSGEDMVQIVADGSVFVYRNDCKDAGLVCVSVDTTGGGTIERNRIQRAGAAGILSVGNDLLLVRNNVSGTLGPGLDHSGTMATVLRNRVKESSGIGISVIGDGNELRSNNVTRCSRDGILVAGSSNVIVDNTSSRNGGDGIDLHENGAVLNNFENEIVDNRCQGNGHEGIDNSGLDTIIDRNLAKGNGSDLGPEIAGAGNDVNGDGMADGTVASFEDNRLGKGTGLFDPGGETTAQRLDLGEP